MIIFILAAALTGASHQTFPWHLYVPTTHGYRMADSFAEAHDCYEQADHIAGAYCDRDPYMT